MNLIWSYNCLISNFVLKYQCNDVTDLQVGYGTTPLRKLAGAVVWMTEAEVHTFLSNAKHGKVNENELTDWQKDRHNVVWCPLNCAKCRRRDDWFWYIFFFLDDNWTWKVEYWKLHQHQGISTYFSNQEKFCTLVKSAAAWNQLLCPF